MRIGQGYDVHAFTEGDHLVIGGVTIPYHKAFKAHSDGDVLLHAIADALLGAAALGDIGRHYPDTDAQFSNADSRVLLRDTVSKIHELGYRCLNIDSTIIAQSPAMSPHIENMRDIIAADLGIDIDQVNVKATTTERLGFCGREEGIAAMATVLLDARMNTPETEKQA